ncbi:phosphate ABC transporter permease, partial [Pseudomonas syringae pv. actinidiae ICMP 18807]
MNELFKSSMNQSSPPERIDFNTPAMQRKRRVRALKDRLTHWYVAIGGLAVLAAITLIFFYLAYVVAPLFKGASLTSAPALDAPWMQGAGEPLMISIEEQNLIGMRVSDKGEVIFFNVQSGAELHRVALPLPAGVSVASIGKDQPGAPLIALGLSNGQVLIFRHTYLTTYPNNQKTITPSVAWPYGETPLVLDEAGRAVEHVTVSADGDSLKVAGSTGTQLH